MSERNGSEPTGAPIKPVMIRIGDAEYPLRYTGRTLLALEDMGLTPDQFYADVKAWFRKDTDGKTVLVNMVKASTVFKFLFACLPTGTMTFDEFSEQQDPLQFGPLFAKALEVMGKTRPSSVQLRETTAETEAPTLQ
jgi:hypothetical protein